MEEIKKIVYRSNDGREFDDMLKCKGWEDFLSHVAFYLGKCGTDFTEGKYQLSKSMLVAVYADPVYSSRVGKLKALPRNVLATSLGPEDQFVMGSHNLNAMSPNWSLSEEPVEGTTAGLFSLDADGKFRSMFDVLFIILVDSHGDITGIHVNNATHVNVSDLLFISYEMSKGESFYIDSTVVRACGSGEEQISDIWL